MESNGICENDVKLSETTIPTEEPTIEAVEVEEFSCEGVVIFDTFEQIEFDPLYPR